MWLKKITNMLTRTLPLLTKILNLPLFSQFQSAFPLARSS